MAVSFLVNGDYMELLILTNWEGSTKYSDEKPATVPYPNAPDRYAGGLNKLNQAILFVLFLARFKGQEANSWSCEWV